VIADYSSKHYLYTSDVDPTRAGKRFDKLQLGGYSEPPGVARQESLGQDWNLGKGKFERDVLMD